MKKDKKKTQTIAFLKICFLELECRNTYPFIGANWLDMDDN